MVSEVLKRTPLYDQHLKLGGKIVPFAGWELPVQYSGVIEEHRAVRNSAGLFDVSHMGEILVTGSEAEAALNYLTCNDVTKLTDGKGQYSAIINQNGGVVDDIIVYRYSKERYFICVNASNSDKDFAWFTKHNKFKATFENQSNMWGQVALQGPKAERILEKLYPAASALKYFEFVESKILDSKAIIARTGYTGEDGFEIFYGWSQTPKLWEALLESGRTQALLPAGLGARDSLRLEACYPLHGHELGDEISALESGLGWIVKFDKGDFLGRQALLREKESGIKRSLVAFYVNDPGIVRHGDKLFNKDGKEIGFTTSGTKTPTINRALGLAILESAYKELDTEIFADVRGKKLSCRVAKKPFYKKPV